MVKGDPFLVQYQEPKTSTTKNRSKSQFQTSKGSTKKSTIKSSPSIADFQEDSGIADEHAGIPINNNPSDIEYNSDGHDDEDNDDRMAGKRLARAKAYLHKLKRQDSTTGDAEAEDEDESLAAAADREHISKRLRTDHQQSRGMAFRPLAERAARALDTLLLNGQGNGQVDLGCGIQMLADCSRGHCHTVTAVVFASGSDRWLYSVGMDGRLIGYDLLASDQAHSSNGKEESNDDKKRNEKSNQNNSIDKNINGNKSVVAKLHPAFRLQVTNSTDTSNAQPSKKIKTFPLLCLDSHEAGYLLAGAKDGSLFLYSSPSSAATAADQSSPPPKLIRCFSKQHRDAVTSVCFRDAVDSGMPDVCAFSASTDRSIKVWNISQLSYMDTLYGHQEGITDLHALRQDACVSVGGRDRSLRLFRVADASQLVMSVNEAKHGSLECVRMLSQTAGSAMMIAATDDGHLLLFSTSKKRPLLSMAVPDELLGPNRLVTAIGVAEQSDLIAVATEKALLLYQLILPVHSSQNNSKSKESKDGSSASSGEREGKNRPSLKLLSHIKMASSTQDNKDQVKYNTSDSSVGGLS